MIADIPRMEVRANGHSLCYYTAGAGSRVVVLLHGGGSDSSLLSWRYAMPALAKKYRVIAFDLPGFGGSEPPKQPPATEFYAETIAAALAELGLQKISLCGLSMGGAISIMLALKQPELVEKLALVASYGLSSALPRQKLIHLLLKMEWFYRRIRSTAGLNPHLLRRAISLYIVHNREILTDDFVQEVLQQVRGGNGAAFFAWCKSEIGWSALQTNFCQRLGGLQMPVLLVHGEEDALIPASAARAAAECLQFASWCSCPIAGIGRRGRRRKGSTKFC